MDKAQSDRIHELCAQVAVETDHARFMKLLTELNDLLAATKLPSLHAKQDREK